MSEQSNDSTTNGVYGGNAVLSDDVLYRASYRCTPLLLECYSLDIILFEAKRVTAGITERYTRLYADYKDN